MDITNHDVQAFFLEAMAQGYAQEGTSKHRIEELPGTKLIVHESGAFRLTDTYVVAPESQRSAGQTIITHDGTPVWTMLYGGWYPPEVIEFLKACLRFEYTEVKQFTGGRGPQKKEDGTFRYENNVRKPGFFAFEGEEYIVPIKAPPIRDWRNVLGSHWYKGMSLLPGTASLAD